MSGIVILQRQEISPDEVLNGSPVSSGRQWYPGAYAANWLSGHGAVLVPGIIVDKTVANGTTGVLHFRVLTRAQAIERIWTLQLRGATAGSVATIKAPASTGVAQVVTVGTGRGRLPIVYREVLGSAGSALTDLTLEIAAVGDIEIDSVTCFELTRPIFDGGIDAQTTRPRERIYEGNGVESVTGVYAGMLTCDARRVGIYHWAVPDITPVTRTGAYTNLLTLAMPVLARNLNGGTTATVYWAAYAKVNAGSGDVLLTTTQSGVSDSVNITTTSYAWTTKRAITISCEDMAAFDGLQSSTFDDLQIQLRGNGGNTLSLAAVSVWDEETT